MSINSKSLIAVLHHLCSSLLCKKKDLGNITFLPLTCICSGRAEGWVCDNPPAPQFVGSKQEVSLAIIAPFSMESRSFGPKKTPKKQSERHPPTSGQRAALKRHSGQQCMGLTCQESRCVENAVEGKLSGAKEAKQPERKRKKRRLTRTRV